jgi:tetratricopeptide (TPR) repeat protein
MFRKARVSAAKALDVNPNLAAAHAVLGDLAFRKDWDWPKADAEFTRATELEPNDGRIRASYAIFLVAMGRQEQGVAQMEKAHELDPVSERNVSGAVFISVSFDRAIGRRTRPWVMPRSRDRRITGSAGRISRGDARSRRCRISTRRRSVTPAGCGRAYEMGGLRGYWQYQRRGPRRKPLDACWTSFNEQGPGPSRKWSAILLRRTNLRHRGTISEALLSSVCA